MKNYKEIIKKTKNYIGEISKNSQQKSIIMLVIMVIFFFLVVVGLRNNNNYEEAKVEKKDYEFSLEKIKQGNYHFVYSIKNNENIISYEGDSNNKKSLFSNDNNNYYLYKGQLLKDYNGVWARTDNYKYMEFTDIEKIEELIKNASFDKKEEYSDMRKVYNYNISTNTITKIILEKDTDIDDIPNKITLITDNENNVNEIDFDISSYSKYKENIANTSINLKYSKFGEIEEIENPE